MTATNTPLTDAPEPGHGWVRYRETWQRSPRDLRRHAGVMEVLSTARSIEQERSQLSLCPLCERTVIAHPFDDVEHPSAPPILPPERQHVLCDGSLVRVVNLPIAMRLDARSFPASPLGAGPGRSCVTFHEALPRAAGAALRLRWAAALSCSGCDATHVSVGVAEDVYGAEAALAEDARREGWSARIVGPPPHRRACVTADGVAATCPACRADA